MKNKGRRMPVERRIPLDQSKSEDRTVKERPRSPVAHVVYNEIKTTPLSPELIEFIAAGASFLLQGAVLFSPDLRFQMYGIRSRLSAFSPVSRHEYCFPAAILSSCQKGWASKTGAARTTEDDNKISIGPRIAGLEKDSKEIGVVYHGPISSTIKKVKLLSLSTCCLSVSLGPVITFMTSPGMNVIVKGAVASTVMILSASTTAALHWFVSPYVHRLRWQPGSDSFEVEMMSWLATYIPRTIKFSDVRPAKTNRPFVTFKADGNYYFIDAEHCHNKALLARLTPQESPHDSAFKNL